MIWSGGYRRGIDPDRRIAMLNYYNDNYYDEYFKQTTETKQPTTTTTATAVYFIIIPCCDVVSGLLSTYVYPSICSVGRRVRGWEYQLSVQYIHCITMGIVSIK